VGGAWASETLALEQQGSITSVSGNGSVNQLEGKVANRVRTERRPLLVLPGVGQRRFSGG
jgi:hypothetical protein